MKLYNSPLLLIITCLNQLFNPLGFIIPVQAGELSVLPKPITVIPNKKNHYALINSVEFHPSQNLFAVTYSQNDKVILYEINPDGKTTPIQTLSNPLAQFHWPQHALFYPDGTKLLVVNWTQNSFNIHKRESNGLFTSEPIAVISVKVPTDYRPHGAAFSPFGNLLAIAYGAGKNDPRAIALFRVSEDGLDYELIQLLQDPQSLLGVPKGITFSPDGNSLLVSFVYPDSLTVFDFYTENGLLCPEPGQSLQGPESQISRGEDVSFSSDGHYCAITNTGGHTISIHPFDSKSNRITQIKPSFILKNPQAHLHHPHGICFSPDGEFLVITQFGPVTIKEDGHVIWNNQIKPSKATVNVYRLSKPNLF